MSVGVVTPVVPDANDLLLGEGTVYANYGEVGEAIIGATQGGSKYIVEKKTIITKYDSSNGPTKGLNRIDIFIPRLIINFLKLSYVSLAYGVPSTVTDMTTYYSFRFDLAIVAADVLTNVAFIGQKFDGKACKIIVKNALNDGDIDLNYKTKGEVVGAMQYTGHYLFAYPTLPPFEMREYDI